MCGIIGAFHPEAWKIISQGMQKQKHRGLDSFGYFDGKHLFHEKSIEALPLTQASTIIAHNLHAIVNHIPQPVAAQGKEPRAVVFNGEIYNWETLKQQENLQATNDTEVLFALLQKKSITEVLSLVDGVYAFGFWQGTTIVLARDIIGVKPLWYAYDEQGFAFASEKKALTAFFAHVHELHPRQILQYDLSTNKIIFHHRAFFSLATKALAEVDAEKKLKALLYDAVKKRIPDKPFGLLFSGGLDSVLLAKILKDLGQSFTCYTVATSEQSQDLQAAKEAAEALGLSLRWKIITEEEGAEALKIVVPLIEDSNVIKVGVALPFYFAAAMAKENGKKVLFSGLGADELFAGYHRYKQSPLPSMIQYDCYSDLLKMFEKNTYRDDTITMYHQQELRLPFLDKRLVQFGLEVPPELKIKEHQEKYLLRKLALHLGIAHQFASRKKKAAQYGSGFAKMIAKLAKKNNYLSQSAYLYQFYPQPIMRLAPLLSSGKDGLYASYIMKKQNYALGCAITIKSKNQSSYMFHTPNVHLVALQAKAMNIALIEQETEGEKEKELEDLAKAIEKAKQEYQIDGIITGALYSNYQRQRIEQLAEQTGVKVFSPLWHINQEDEMRSLVKEGFLITLQSIAAEGLSHQWLGKALTAENIESFLTEAKKAKINPAGEGGEFESLVLDCPLFSQKIILKKTEVIKEDKHTAKLLIKEATLEEKRKE